MRYFYFFIILFIAFSCQSGADQRLKLALQFAGNNRTELEKVLEHYRDSGEKFLAARFLIENMPGHYSYAGPELDSLKALKSFAARFTYIPDEKKAQWKNFSYSQLQKVYDSKVITSAYLIRHIDRIFALRDQRPWNQYLSFEDFCEFLLPYRVGDEPLEEWIPAYQERYSQWLDSVYQGQDVVEACSLIVQKLRIEDMVYNTDFSLPHLGALFLLDNRVGTCKESCDMSVYALRAAGIPVTTDHYPFSPTIRWGHSWNVLKDTTGIQIPFWYNELAVKRGNSDYRKKGKVYRYCFGHQPELLPGCRDAAEVPGIFRHPFLKDISADYFPGPEVSFPLLRPTETPFAYLGVFYIHNWVPIAIGQIRRDSAVFSDIEPEVIYQLLTHQASGLQPEGYPFVYTRQGIVRYFIPDNVHRQTVTLIRKYPHNPVLAAGMNRLAGGKIEGDCRADFSKPVLLHNVPDSISTAYNYVYLHPRKKLRYLRFSFAPAVVAPTIAELAAFPDSSSLIPYESEALKTEILWPANKEPYVNDHNPLTYTAIRPGHSIVLDLKAPQTIGKLLYIPQNDDNFIRVGDSYELFYNNGKDNWISLGEQTATGHQLIYPDVPQNALLWLRNLTRGNEEHVFYYENNRQIFL